MILEFKNMLSFGNDEVHTVDLESPLVNQFYGENGLGKSNVLRIIKIACYFDYPAKIEKLVNDHKESGYIKVYHDNHTIEQIFSRKKVKSLKVYKDGEDEPIDTGKIASTKSWISNNLFPIPKDVFYNIYIPSIDDFKSFIGMSAEDSRKIRDELFSFTTLNEKLIKIRKENSAIKSKIDMKDAENQTLIKFKEESDQKILDLEKQSNEEREKQIKDISQRAGEIQGDITKTSENISTAENNLKFKKRHLLSVEIDSAISINKDRSIEIEEMDATIKKLDEYNHILSHNLKCDKILRKEKEIREKSEYVNKTLGKLNLHEENEAKAKINKEILSRREEEKKLEKKKAQKESLSEALTKAEALREKHVSEHLELKSKISEIKRSIEDTEARISVKDLGDVCDKCYQTIDITEERVNELKSDLETYKSDLQSKNEAMEELRSANDSNKADMSEYKMEIKHVSGEISKIEAFIETAPRDAEFHENLEIDDTIDADELKENIESNQKSIQTLEGEVKYLKEDLDSHDKKDASHITDYETAEEVKSKLDKIHANRNQIQRQYDSLETSISEKRKIYGEMDEGEYDSDIDDIDEYEESINSLKESKIRKEEEHKSLTKELEKLRNSNTNELIESEKERAKNLEDSIERTAEELEGLKEELEIGLGTEYVLSEDGIKKWHLDNIRKSFSKELNDSLRDFNLAVRFDRNFSIKIYKNGIELEHGLMSVGQKKIVNVIICMQFIQLYNKKYPSIKTVIMDESMSNLSRANSHKIIKKVKENLVANGFSYTFIHHAPLDRSLCDRRYGVFERSTYTKLEIEN